MKNILIIKGSPRRKGNSNQLVDFFIKGAEKSGNIINIFDSFKDRIDGCVVCYSCWQRGTPCSFSKDKFNDLAILIEESDIILFASPLYWGSFSGHLKNALDKFHSFTMENNPRPLINKKTILFSTAYYGIEAFDGLIRQFMDINKYLDWDILDILTVPNVDNIGDIKNNPNLQTAYNIGYAIQ